ncbi:MAG: hypothetical protein WA993_13745 [Candidatus Binatus sp.]|uniref:hypothetical protein n=1 Tax=Candidatus Binatus sp. TaxID=2811406 RepID=UPI003CAC6F8F
MSSSIPKEIHLLLDSAGALIVFQEKGAPWAGVLAFSSEDLAREFCRISNLDAAEVAAISTGDPQAVAGLITSIKRRAIRNLLLDLDYKTGACTQIDFVGDSLGTATPRQFTPPVHH